MPTGRSLHIGINAVDPAHYSDYAGELAGCEADASDLASIAASRGFAATRLITAEATRAHVIKAIGEALDALADGDVFLLTFAGRGGRVPDLHVEDPEGVDDAWCLYDGAFLENELHTLLAGFQPGVRVVVVSDCCRSSVNFVTFRTLADSPATRALVDPRSDPTAPLPAVRLLPAEIGLRTFREHRDFYSQLQGPRSKEKVVDTVRASVRILAACQDNQLALDGAHNGLFTATLLTVWKEGAFEGDYADFHRAIVGRMPLTQVPHHFRAGGLSKAFDRQKPFTV